MDCPPSSPPRLLPGFVSKGFKIFQDVQETGLETPLPTSDRDPGSDFGRVLSSEPDVQPSRAALQPLNKITLSPDTPLLVGRSSRCQYVLKSSSKLISRIHARVSYESATDLVTIECLGWNGLTAVVPSRKGPKEYPVVRHQTIYIERTPGIELVIQNLRTFIEVPKLSETTEDEQEDPIQKTIEKLSQPMDVLSKEAPIPLLKQPKRVRFEESSRSVSQGLLSKSAITLSEYKKRKIGNEENQAIFTNSREPLVRKTQSPVPASTLAQPISPVEPPRSQVISLPEIAEKPPAYTPLKESLIATAPVPKSNAPEVMAKPAELPVELPAEKAASSEPTAIPEAQEAEQTPTVKSSDQPAAKTEAIPPVTAVEEAQPVAQAEPELPVQVAAQEEKSHESVSAMASSAAELPEITRKANAASEAAQAEPVTDAAPLPQRVESVLPAPIESAESTLKPTPEPKKMAEMPVKVTTPKVPRPRKQKKQPAKAQIQATGPIPPHPSSDLDSLINCIAFSRLNSTPLSQVAEAAPSITRKDVVAMLASTDCVGVIQREGKDALGKLLDPEYYYVAELDTNPERTSIISQSSRKSLRACRKVHKQYFYKKPK